MNKGDNTPLLASLVAWHPTTLFPDIYHCAKKKAMNVTIESAACRKDLATILVIVVNNLCVTQHILR
jgi:hypothetical protein